MIVRASSRKYGSATIAKSITKINYIYHVKFLCTILTFMVLLLTVKPCCADNCADETSISKTEQNSTSPTEKECAGCSPFFACGTCVGFVVHKLVQLTFIAQPEVVTHVSSYKQPLLKEITLSIWQPPQLS
ncbi:DUF6660 family protein [Mucilaginibacter antarcticus]|uniref:DUF6660 family protein n=1 Tax=Mucilaginibacter antarcticus TaxID=1855725 RepID=A0ABW5XNQ5_9SPHI